MWTRCGWRKRQSQMIDLFGFSFKLCELLAMRHASTLLRGVESSCLFLFFFFFFFLFPILSLSVFLLLNNTQQTS